MSNLEALKERLKHKPEVRPNEGVRVILAPLPSEERIKKGETQTIITVDKDDGKRAQEILEKIKQNKLSNVIKKIAEEPKVEILSKAPEKEKEKEKEKVNKPKKMKKDKVFLFEEPEKNLADEEGDEGQREQEEQREKEEQREQGEQREEQEEEREEEIVINQKKRSTKKVPKGVIELGPENMIKIGDTRLEKRLPQPPAFNMKVSSLKI